MYEFIVLALLMAGPMHGYGIRQIMNRIIGPHRTVAWGPLYTTLRKLQGAGLIEAAPDEEPLVETSELRGGPPSKRYRLTEAGRARFHTLMAVPSEPEPEYEFTFGVKLARMGHVPPEQRLALLRDYHDYCLARLAHLGGAAQAVTAYHKDPFPDRPWVLATMDRWRAIYTADATWVEQQIQLLEATGGELPDPYAGIGRTARESDDADHEKGACV